MFELLLAIVIATLVYLAVRSPALWKRPPGVVFDVEPAELGSGTVTREFVLEKDEWIGQVLFDGVKWNAVLEHPQNGVPGNGSDVIIVRIAYRRVGDFTRPIAEVKWSSPMPPDR